MESLSKELLQRLIEILDKEMFVLHRQANMGVLDRRTAETSELLKIAREALRKESECEI